MSASIEFVSTSTSTSMSCSSCKQQFNIHELVRVYAKSYNDFDNSASQKVCGFCLSGYHIPVLRPSTGKWELGTVLSYNGSSSRNNQYQHQYALKFANGAKEWVSVRADPYEAYAQYFDDILEAVRSRKKSPDCHSYGMQNTLSDPVNVMISPNRLQYLYHQDSYPIENMEVSCDTSKYNDFFVGCREQFNSLISSH